MVAPGPMNNADFAIIAPYVYTALLLNAALCVLAYREVRAVWEELPPMKWRTISFLLGLMAVLVASLLEFPFIAPLKFGEKSASLFALFLLGMAVGPIEEFSKLLPVKIFHEELWVLWKKAVGTAFFFGLIEAVLYSIVLTVAGEPVMALLRFVLVGFHVALTAISATILLVEGSWGGYIRASVYHSLYDLPVLLFAGGYTGPLLYALMLVGVVAIIAIIVDFALSVKKAGRLKVGEIPGEGFVYPPFGDFDL
ncbi:hypothetical protein A3L09_04325 [Thermococcus profundus]|uniref:Uncharacterized protein n=2 Tax=Thermococcus profundus TaxID=49899 RepID=A0A2Z2MD49_THEPR|nr:hypothetical protein A3L09_04325 [Thermococcus profundus]